MVSLLDVPYQNVGIVVRRSRMDELGPRLVPLLRSIRAGIERFYADKPFAMKVIGKYTKESDQDVLDRTYEFYKKAGFRREMVTSEPGPAGHAGFLIGDDPRGKNCQAGAIFRRPFLASGEQRKVVIGKSTRCSLVTF